MPRALITGVSGQDGSYLAELLVGKGYDVHGTVRGTVLSNLGGLPLFLRSLGASISLHKGYLEEPEELASLVLKLNCDECYHLAGPGTVDSDLLGDPAVFSSCVRALRALLGAVEAGGNRCRVFFAGSSEMFGRASVSPQDEGSPFQPRSIYGLARLAGYHAVRQFRNRTGGFACTGILYNHESPRRRPVFLPRKVSLAAARIKLGVQARLALGNLDSVRDWGYAPEFAKAMWLMLQQRMPQDFVIATGRTHSVGELVELAFKSVGLDYRDHVVTDPQFFRPTEAVSLCGNSARIAEATGWTPEKSFEEMVAEMVAHDLGHETGATGRKPNLPVGMAARE
jgi:GDPmannose 4,6-dehydratase